MRSGGWEPKTVLERCSEKVGGWISSRPQLKVMTETLREDMVTKSLEV